MSRLLNFFTAPVEPADQHPLKVALERKPAEFLHFYQSSLLLSLAHFLARLPIVLAAIRWWGVCDCGRPLAFWLLADGLFAFVQVPLRAGMLAYLPSLSEGPSSHDSQLATKAFPVLSSQAWLLSKRVSTAHFVWNLVGVLWGLEAKESSCPLRTLTRFVVASALIRTVALLAFYYARVCQPPQIATIKYQAATAEVDLFGEDHCAVCLGEFCEHQPLRQFACKHAFCEGCADRWLQVRRVCPTCLRPT